MHHHFSITREDIQGIVDVLSKFPEATSVKLLFDNVNDSGYTLSASINTDVNGLMGEFIVPIVTILS